MEEAGPTHDSIPASTNHLAIAQEKLQRWYADRQTVDSDPDSDGSSSSGSEDDDREDDNDDDADDDNGEENEEVEDNGEEQDLPWEDWNVTEEMDEQELMALCVYPSTLTMSNLVDSCP